ncbi:uncharacterized protein BJX67DRAFT_200131 [Aspergillus lucknowensis]|uniref:DUF7136 domain-containing protein n=1 Tax=Aspergillus lucknowensis TaxID=176173 RepID=A0ABR4LJW0_9EURO
MVSLSRTSLWLALCALVATDTSFPAHIEVDVLFPRNETYNNLTSFPVVLAVQNIEAAYKFEWDISWKMFNASPAARETDYESGYGSYSSLLSNNFQWYFDDVAVVPMLGYNFTTMDPGNYRLEWEYITTPCTREPPNTIVYNIRETVASGTLHFSVVNDGTGLEFDIPIDECPHFGDIWSVRDATYTYCPFLGSSEGVESEPCAARLESREQVECIRQYLFEGTVEVPNNETETCRSAFDRVDPEWLEYDDDDDDDDGGDGDDGDRGSTGPGNLPAGDDGGEGSTGSSNLPAEDDDDSAVSVRPGMLGAVVAGVAIVAAL